MYGERIGTGKDVAAASEDASEDASGNASGDALDTAAGEAAAAAPSKTHDTIDAAVRVPAPRTEMAEVRVT